MTRIERLEDGPAVVEGPATGLSAHLRRRHHDLWVHTPSFGRFVAAEDPGAIAAAVELLRAAATSPEADGGERLRWEVDEEPPGPARRRAIDAVGRALALTPDRTLLRMHRALPLEPDLAAPAAPAAVRALRPGTADEAAWVRTNAAAFADHPDQGGETLDDLRRAMAEPWFDPAGFLVVDGEPPVEQGGDLAGSCWTKVHPGTDGGPTVGEIYVIGVHPDHAGRGLGRVLVQAGLAHLARVAEEAMLYVEADNDAALALYRDLGFVPRLVRHVRSGPLPLR